MENNCYMTLCTVEDFLPCVIRNSWAMEYLNFKYPYVVMIPKGNKYIKEQLELNNIQYREINVLKFDDSSYKREYNDTINKFQILTFTEFDKICFLDADIVMLENIDKEFKKLDNFKGSIYGYGEDLCTGSFFLGKPDLKLFGKILKHKKEYCNDDQVIQNLLCLDKESKDGSTGIGEMFHYIGSPKPWTSQNFNNYFLKWFFTETSKEEFFYIIENEKNWLTM